MLHRDLMEGDEIVPRARPHRTIDDDTADGIDPVEHDKANPRFLRRLHRQAHRRDKGVEAATDVLDVEDEGIESGELGRGRFALFGLVKAIDRQSRGRVDLVVDHFLIEHPADAVLGREKHLQFDLRRVGEQIDGGAPLAIDARLIGDEADFFPFQQGKPIALEHVDAVEHRRRITRRCFPRGH